MPFFKPSPRFAPAFYLVALLLARPALAADIAGSIRFSDENFSVSVSTIDRVLRLSSRGCNTFDLVLQPAPRTSVMVIRDRAGRSLGTIGNDHTIETRTCGADRYSTQIDFNAPTRTKWTPQADELIGTRRVKYSAEFAPAQLHFDPPVEFTVYDRKSRARPIRIAEVATAQFQSDLPIVYSANALHFETSAGTIERSGGFTADDEFFLESESQRFSRPANGDGEQITFEAPSDQQPTSLSLYYPPGGPHMLAFSANEREREPTSIKSLRVDDEQLLTPQFAIIRSDRLTLRRAFLRFSSGDQLATGSVQVVVGSTGSDVSHIQAVSSDPTAVQLAASSAGPFSPFLDLSKVVGGRPFDIFVQVRARASDTLGAHNYTLTLTSEGGLKRDIPITLNVTDPYTRTRTVVLVAMLLILIAAVAWTLMKRRRAESQAADHRAVFFQKHYGEYSETREQIEVALAADATGSKAAEVLNAFAARRLQTVLNTQQWNDIKELAAQQKSREALEALDRALAQLEG